MSLVKMGAAAVASWALLALYFSAAGTEVGPAEWLASFSWEPASRPLSLGGLGRTAAEAGWALGAFAGWLAAAWAGGRGLLRLLKAELDAPAERELAAVGLGLGALSLGAFALAGLGWLTLPGALALGALLACAGGFRRPGLSLPVVPSGPAALAGWTALGALAFHLAGALLPPTSFDELCYQLTLPKLYVLHGGFVDTKFNHLSFLPRNMGMLYALGLLTGPAAAAKLFYWGMGVLGACALAVYGRRWWGREAGLWAAAIFILTPVVGNQFRSAAADLGVGFYELMGLFLLLRWREEGKPGLLTVSAAFWGLALGTKYTAVPGAAVSLILAATAGRGARPAAAFAAIAGALWSPWLVRNWIDCGNPVAPLLSTVIESRNFFFAGRYEPLVDYAAGGLGIPHYFPGLSAREWLLLPWTLSVRYNDYSHDLGALFLVCLPLAAALRGASPRTRLLAVIAAAYWALWLAAGVRMSRYFVAGLGLTSLLAGIAAARAVLGRSPGWAWALAAPLLVALFQQGARATKLQNDLKKPWGWLAGRAELGEYVSSAQPDMPMSVFAYANRELPTEAKTLVINEFRAFYLDRDFRASTPWDHDYWHEYLRLSSGPADLRARLKADGFTHLLVNETYVLKKTGRRRVRPDAWTPEDESRSAEFLKQHARELFREGGSWLAEL